MSNRISGTAMTITLATAVAAFVNSASAADFYAGKTIQFVVGADEGGGYDTYARAIAKHWPDFIPGHPAIAVTNMPSTGSGKAAAYISTAPNDGTVIATLMPAAIVGPLFADKEKPSYDPAKFQYIGTADNGARVCATFQTSKIKSFADAQRQKTLVGALSSPGLTHDYAIMHRKSSRAKFELVATFERLDNIYEAMEAGKVDGLCGWDWATVKKKKSEWLRDKKINLLVQVGIGANRELDELSVPPIWKFIDNESDRKAVELVVSQQVFARPYLAPPGTPAAQIAILRKAFDALMKDKNFLADAKKARLDINPTGGAEVQKLVTRIYTASPATIKRAKELVTD